MLWQRILTALALVPFVVAAILLLDNALLAAILAVVLLLGAAEMAHLAGLDRLPTVLAYVVAVAASMWLVWVFAPATWLAVLQQVLVGWWCLVTILLVRLRHELVRVEGRRPLIMLVGAVVLVGAWVSAVHLHAVAVHGPVLLLFLFVLIWTADSGAYFAGRAFGRRKLSPLVSPGKTWAGVAGAMAGAVVCALGLWYSGWAGQAGLVPLVLLCLVVTAVSIGGDLWESKLKREAGVKDSGALLPGHGGVLDRIDSLLAAAPVFTFGASLIGVTG